MKILHLEANRYSQESLDSLRTSGELIVIDTEADIKDAVANNQVNAIFTRLGFQLDEKVLSSQHNLKYIISPTTGLNHIDLTYCHDKGIQVISLKGENIFLANVQSTSEHTWMLLLSLIRNQRQAMASVLEGKWEREAFLANELNSKTLGIIGFGRLGKILARYGRAFDMNVIANDINPLAFAEESFVENVDLTELLERADYVLLQVDYRLENREMANEEFFKQMKKKAYFINTARGELVNEKALLKALESGSISGAALDVLNGDSSWQETSAQSQLIEYSKTNENLLITPHMGGYGKTSIELTRDFVTQKFIKHINYEASTNS